MISKPKTKKEFLMPKKETLLSWLSLVFKILPDLKFLMLSHNVTEQASKSEWLLVIILWLPEPSPKMLVFWEDRKINSSWKELSSSNLSEESYARSAGQPPVIVLEQSKKPKNKKSNSESIPLPMVTNLIKSKTNYLFWPDPDLKTNMLWLLASRKEEKSLLSLEMVQMMLPPWRKLTLDSPWVLLVLKSPDNQPPLFYLMITLTQS